jgi:hypothetical protein
MERKFTFLIFLMTYLYGPYMKLNFRCRKGSKNPDTFECPDTKKEVVAKDKVSEDIFRTSSIIDIKGPLYYNKDHDKIQVFRQTLTKEDIKVVDKYVGKGEPEVNIYLRKNTYNTKMENEVKILDNLINNYQISSDTLLFRGVNHPDLYNLQRGDEYSDPGFISTTENIKWTEFFINQPDNPGPVSVSNPCLFVIKARAGQHAAPLSAIKSPKQQEFLLPRGTTLRIDAVKYSGKIKILEASIVHKRENT